MPDLLGYEPTRAPFIDIRNQREGVASEKATLCGELNTLLRKTPPHSRIASVQQSREFKHAHKAALKVLQAKTSSRQELSSAITSMRAWIE